MKNPKDVKTYFFEDKPLFGLDIGHDTIRVMQFDTGHKIPKILGYGAMPFDPTAIENGVIVKPEVMAKAAVKLFNEKLIGEISTKRVAVALPASRMFTRAVQLPKMNENDIHEAVYTEIGQYIPNGVDNMCLDYMPIREDDAGIEVFVVAVPREIINSYLLLTRMLGLEAILFDTAIGASARMFKYDKLSNIPSVLVDFGAKSADLTVFNHGLVVTGTVAFGGDEITDILSKALHVTTGEAIALKSKYGLSKSPIQKQVLAALQPSLDLLLKEIRRTVRYYEQRYDKEPHIDQIITMGGGANMPGLVDYLTEQLRLPARAFSLTTYIDFGRLRPIGRAEHMTYVTAAGLAITVPSEVFA